MYCIMGGDIFDACLCVDIDINPDNVIESPSGPGTVQPDPQTFEWNLPDPMPRAGGSGTGYIESILDNSPAGSYTTSTSTFIIVTPTPTPSP